LGAEFGRGFEEKNLRRMLQFAEAFPDEAIVATLWRQLSWSHFRELLPLKQPLQREFYAEMCRIEGWSVRTLAQRIDSMRYERTALSRKPQKLVRQELAALRAAAAASGGHHPAGSPAEPLPSIDWGHLWRALRTRFGIESICFCV
jgi:hypothetical protein